MKNARDNTYLHLLAELGVPRPRGEELVASAACKNSKALVWVVAGVVGEGDRGHDDLAALGASDFAHRDGVI